MKINSFLEQYLATALWSSIDENDDPFDDNYSIDDFSEEALKQADKDCGLFIKKAGDLLDGFDDTDIAHDFWLTRNGHGAGFWDGDYPDDIGDKLTEIADEFRELHIYVADDGKLYFE
tara:strand:- start:9 stop:362 length:354 start_codon:yes stop_codon:yes gene_type:complete